MWRNFEPQTQNKKAREKNVFRLLRNRTKATNQFGTYPLVGLVNVQQTLERIVLAAKPVRLRKEGLGIRVNSMLIQCPGVLRIINKDIEKVRLISKSRFAVATASSGLSP